MNTLVCWTINATSKATEALGERTSRVESPEHLGPLITRLYISSSGPRYYFTFGATSLGTRGQYR